MIDALDSLTAIDTICRRCRKQTLLIGADVTSTLLVATIRTALSDPGTLCGRFYKAGWNVVKIENLGGDYFQFRCEAVKS